MFQIYSSLPCKTTYKKSAETTFLLIPSLRLSHCPYHRISNAEAHALGIQYMHYKPPMDEEHCVIAVIILNLRDSATTDKTPLQRLFQYVCLLPKVCVNSGRVMSCPRPYPSRPRHNDATKIRNYLQFDKKRDQPAQPCIAFSYSYCRISHIRIAIKDNSSLGLHFGTFDNPLYVMSMYSLLNLYGILPQC